MLEAKVTQGTKLQGPKGWFLVRQVYVEFNPFNDRWELRADIADQSGELHDGQNLQQILDAIEHGNVKVL